MVRQSKLNSIFLKLHLFWVFYFKIFFCFVADYLNFETFRFRLKIINVRLAALIVME